MESAARREVTKCYRWCAKSVQFKMVKVREGECRGSR